MSGENINSPFMSLESFVYKDPEPMLLPQTNFAAPFEAKYLAEDGEAIDPEAEEYVVFLNELQDDEFGETLYELIGELTSKFEGIIENESVNQPNYRGEMLRRLEMYVDPLIKATESMLETMAQGAEQTDLRTMSDLEIDEFIDSYVLSEEQQVKFENWGFFKAIKKVAKKAVKKGVRLAKRGLKVAAKFGFGFVFRKLKKVAMQLMKKVVATAINKLPIYLRPAAHKLRKRYFGKEVELEEGNDSVIDVGQLQLEFNIQVAELIFADNELALEMEEEHYHNEESGIANPIRELSQAREVFIQNITNLNDQEDLLPHVEKFLPAILPALRIGIKLIGREKTIKYIAGYVAKLIRRLVGSRLSKPLADAIVRAGMGYFQLEVGSEQNEARLAGTAVAAIVEETVRKVADFPEYVHEDPQLLEGFVLEAFEQAAAKYLPQLLPEEAYLKKPRLRHDIKYRGVWLSRSGKGKSIVFKKYSKVPRVKISPHKARAIKTFRKNRLNKFLQDQLGLPEGQTIEAQVHLYELVSGSMLSQITKFEQNVPGLGTASPVAYDQLLPLTKEVAGLLLDEPELGQDVVPRFLASQQIGEIGQRYYFLEIEGMRPRVSVEGSKKMLSRSSQAHAILDFPKNQAQISLYLNEREAQELTTQLRDHQTIGAVMVSLSELLDEQVKSAFSGYQLKLIHGSVMPNSTFTALKRVPVKLLERLTTNVKELLGRGLSNFIKKNYEKLIQIAADPADGLTFQIILKDPLGMTKIGEALAGRITPADSNTVDAQLFDIQIVAGYARN